MTPVSEVIAPPSEGGRVEGWNPRYVAYAKANGMDPKQMTRRDKERFPGGCMLGYMIWVQSKWREWRVFNGIRHDAAMDADDHRSFDDWLQRESSKPRR